MFSNARRMNPNNETAHQNARFAVRFSPAIGSPWWDFGSRWLGQCAFTGETFVQPVIEHLPNALHERLTAGPRRHGWHATLKAPFELARGINTAILEHGVDAIALMWHPTVIPSFRVEIFKDILALVPATPCAAVDAIAGACVTGLHPYSAPLPPENLRRCRASGLTAREDALLLRWRHPFVLDQFCFHLPLTSSLRGVTPLQVKALIDAAQHAVEDLPACVFDAISLFKEPAPGENFIFLSRFELSSNLDVI